MDRLSRRACLVWLFVLVVLSLRALLLKLFALGPRGVLASIALLLPPRTVVA